MEKARALLLVFYASDSSIRPGTCHRRERSSAGTARRDAHPKAHGCVKAEIRIVDTLRRSLKGYSFLVKRTRRGFASRTVPLIRRMPTSKEMRVAWQLKC
jgi:hypothetical protein